jgi:hypothetical protein
VRAADAGRWASSVCVTLKRMSKQLPENELKQICRNLAAQSSEILKDSESIKAEDSRMDEKVILLRALAWRVRKASDVDIHKKPNQVEPVEPINAVWVEIHQLLTGFRPVEVDYDYRRIIQEEFLDKVLLPKQ